MKKVILFCFILLTNTLLYAQDYPQWPADKSETGFIEESQSREIRLRNSILPQEIDMQDRMRTLITDMMQNAAKNLGWPVIELSEYSNQNAFQGGGTPYNLRSPRSIEITFQFIVNKDSLLAWKNWQNDYNNRYATNGANAYNIQQDVRNSPLYKRYQDSVNYYINLYTTYTDKLKDEGEALFSKDKKPAYYLKKETEFTNKMVAMPEQGGDDETTKQLDNELAENSHRFRNNTMVQVKFTINNYSAVAINQSLGPIESTSVTYPKSGTKVSKLYSISSSQENKDLVKWNNVLLMLLGNFQTKPGDENVYKAGFNLNGQGDEHTQKKIKSDKVQNISINISGDKTNVEKMAKLIYVEKLNSRIMKN